MSAEWIERAASAICREYEIRIRPMNVHFVVERISEIIQKEYERHLANAVPVDTLALLDQAQTRQRELELSIDGWVKMLDQAHDRQLGLEGLVDEQVQAINQAQANQRELEAKINDQAKELRARKEILDAIAGDVNCWTAPLDWRQKLRDFAGDRELHRVSHAAWERNRGHGVDLYASNGFFTAYYDDAAILWEQADDTRPMHHVGVRSDPPARTCIHPLHLAAWVEHLAGMCLPVQILSGEDLEEDE